MSRKSTMTMLLAAIPIIGSLVAPAALGEPRSFTGHQVVKLSITTEAQLQAVLDLEAASGDFDPWSDAIGIGTIDVRVSPEQKALLDLNGLTYRVVVQDVQTAIDAQFSGAPSFFDDFRTYQEHVDFLNALVASHPDLAEMVSLGLSRQGRDLWAIRITGPGTNKPGVLYHGCEHAREWLTPPVVSYAAEHLLTNYDTDASVRTLVDNVDWYLMPIMNPDGYEYTFAYDRYWRKNRRNNGDGSFGVDLNRNWGFEWGGPGSSDATGSDLYRGPAPFSEPETQAVRDFILAHGEIAAYFDIHTFGRMLLWPWGYTSLVTPDHSTFFAVGSVMADLVAAVHGTQYLIGPGYSTIYPTAGSSNDWVYGAAGRWAFTAELRGWGFAVSPGEIILAAEENLPAMKYLAAWSAACDPRGFDIGLAMAPGAFDDCNSNGTPDVCEMVDNAFVDCNANFAPDQCDIDDGSSEDCDGNLVPDECDPDCNANGVADICEIILETADDCNSNSVPDECDIPGGGCGPPIGLCPGEGDCLDPSGNGSPGCDCAACCHEVCGLDPFCCYVSWDSFCAYTATALQECELARTSGRSQDCNTNGVPDECDVADGTSQDCNSNGVPDTCDPDLDCNNNGVQDICDVAVGTSDDCNGNEVPDVCDSDCNANSTPDECDVADETSKDCNNNNVPDECEADEDCNQNNVQDICDIAALTSSDCNKNEIPDECEGDCNSNGAPDSCDVAVSDPTPVDSCPDAHRACAGHTYFGTTMGMTEDGTSNCGLSGGPDAWYRFRSAEDGLLAVSLCNSWFDTVLSIWTDCPQSGGLEITCSDDSCGWQSSVAISVAADNDYWIRIGGFGGTSGTFVMTLTGVGGSFACDPVSSDCNANQIPDECEEDCNTTGTPDDCDVIAGSSSDCNSNMIPDECDVELQDCNSNGSPDTCDILDCGPPIGSCPGTGDCCSPFGNGSPGCECAICCNAVCNRHPPCCSGTWDGLCAAIAAGTPECDCGGPGQPWSPDCNENDVPDECDLADLTSEDCNGNSKPDDCEQDQDRDGAIDDCDGCPMDSSKLDPGQCGCGESDLDTDGDAIADCVDPDDDNDGVIDTDDLDPLDVKRCQDVDGDTCDDCTVGSDGFGPLADNDPLGDGPDSDGDGICDAGDTIDIPTVSGWGLAILTLSLLVLARVRGKDDVALANTADANLSRGR